MKFKSDFLREINSRGFIYQSSDIDSLDELMSKKKITAYIGFDIYGLSILYSDGQNNGPSYSQVGYSTEAGPGSFSISFGEYEDTGDNTLVGYDWGVGDFTIGFYYYDFEADAAGSMSDDDGAYVSIGRSF